MRAKAWLTTASILTVLLAGCSETEGDDLPAFFTASEALAHALTVAPDGWHAVSVEGLVAADGTGAHWTVALVDDTQDRVRFVVVHGHGSSVPLPPGPGIEYPEGAVLLGDPRDQAGPDLPWLPTGGAGDEDASDSDDVTEALGAGWVLWTAVPPTLERAGPWWVHRESGTGNTTVLDAGLANVTVPLGLTLDEAVAAATDASREGLRFQRAQMVEAVGEEKDGWAYLSIRTAAGRYMWQAPDIVSGDGLLPAWVLITHNETTGQRVRWHVDAAGPVSLEVVEAPRNATALPADLLDSDAAAITLEEHLGQIYGALRMRLADGGEPEWQLTYSTRDSFLDWFFDAATGEFLRDQMAVV